MSHDLAYVKHINENIVAIRQFTQVGREEFLRNLQVQYAVIRAFEIIGEASKRLSLELKDRHPAIPWKNIAGLRDILIHNYMGVDVQRVWQVVENELNHLASAIAQELKD